MSALDVLVSASRYGEALPLAVIEAAAVGLPIITTDVGEIRGLVLDPSHVVTAGNTDAMALALRQLRDHGLSHAWDARKAERNARVMRDYAIADTIARYHALYRAVAAVREVPAAPAPLAGD
jgi:glycosyltransferase involved in cell wall biosynthesis